MLTSKWMLEFICGIPASAVSQKTAYKSVFSFYVATLVNFFSVNSKPLSGAAGEDAIRVVYPFLVAGAKSENEEYKISTYAIISALATVKLEKNLVAALAEHVIVYSLPHTHRHSFAALLVLLQSLDPVDRSLTQNLVQSLTEWKNLAEVAEEVAGREFGNADLSPFYAPYFSFLAAHVASKKSYSKHVSDLLRALPRSHVAPHVPSFGRDLIHEYLKKYSAMNQDLRDDVRALILKLDHAFPRELDLAVDAVLREKKKEAESAVTGAKGSKKRATLASSESWNSLFEGTRHQLLVDPSQASSSKDSFTLAVAFSDGLSQTFSHALSSASPPSLTIRALGLLKSMPFYSSPSASSSDASLPALRTSVLDLIDVDTDPSVLKTLFSLHLQKFLDSELLFQKIQTLLKKLAAGGIDPKERNEVYDLAVSFLVGPFVTKFKKFSDRLLATLLRCVVYHSETPKTDSSSESEDWCTGSSQFNSVAKALAKFRHPVLTGITLPAPGPAKKGSPGDSKEGAVSSLVQAMGKNLAGDCDGLHVLFPFLVEEDRGLSGILYLVQNHALALSKSSIDRFKLSFLLLSQISRDLVGDSESNSAHSSGASDPAPSVLAKLPGLPSYLTRGSLLRLLDGSLAPLQLHSVGAILSFLEEVSPSFPYTSDDQSGSALFSEFPTIVASPYGFSLTCRLLFLVSSNLAFRSEFHKFLPKLFGVVGNQNLVNFLSYFWSSPPNSEIKFSSDTQVLCLRIFQAMLASTGK
jgi:hypothetical protein